MWQNGRMGIRERNREEVAGRILAAAREQIAEVGGVGLSMRAVARVAGLASSAVYRYFPTREALITAMILESYARLAEALEHTDDWTSAARAMRRWALAHPHEFQLIYGTPIPGYVAPPETVPAAERVARRFLTAAASGRVEGFDDPALTAQMDALTAGGITAPLSAAVLAELAALVGFVSLEVAGHLVGTADPADHLFDALLQRQLTTLGL